MTTPGSASLTVHSKQLRDGLKTATKLSREKKHAPVMFTFEDGRLHVVLESMTVSAEASGTWPGQARVAGSLLPLLYESIPPGEHLDVLVQQGRLTIGESSVPCVWEPPFRRIQLPAGAPLWAVLALRQQFTADDIRRSGLEETVEQAEAERDDRISQAVEILGALGITDEQLRELFDQRVKECSRR